MKRQIVFIYKNFNVYNLKKVFTYTRKYGLKGFVDRLCGKELNRSRISYTEYSNKHYCDSNMLSVQELVEKCMLPPGNQQISFGVVTDGLSVRQTIQQYTYVIFLYKDSVVDEKIFRKFSDCIQKENVDLIYSDEDLYTIEPNCKKYCYQTPCFKPDYSIDLLRSYNYVGHSCAVRASLAADIAEEMGQCIEEICSDEALYYEFILRCIEKKCTIFHIPEVLVHQNKITKESKRCSQERLRQVVQEHLERLQIKGAVLTLDCFRANRIKYLYDETPYVSIIIPNRDHIQDLKQCLNSFIEKSSYPYFEVIIAENNSVEKETFSFYSEITNQYENVRVVDWKYSFDYAQINNYAASFAKGQYLLFLNNDTEMINENCIEELLMFCQRDDVGIVGAQLLYADKTIQHAGIIVGLGGVADNLFIGELYNSGRHNARASMQQNFSAVTAACMMTPKEIFEKVGGFSKEFPIAFNDVDYCLKVRELGKLVVYNPQAVLYHYESKTRGKDIKFRQVRRFKKEIHNFRKKWKKFLTDGDCYYNKNLSLDRKDYSCRDD